MPLIYGRFNDMLFNAIVIIYLFIHSFIHSFIHLSCHFI